MLESTENDKGVVCISTEETVCVSKHHFIKAYR